jgi:hypothetical protein
LGGREVFYLTTFPHPQHLAEGLPDSGSEEA